MESLECFGVSIMVGNATPPTPDNQNIPMCSTWQTPAEALQKLRRMKAEMRRELAADFTLRSCPKHRTMWETLIGAERCTLWQYYGVREG